MKFNPDVALRDLQEALDPSYSIMGLSREKSKLSVKLERPYFGGGGAFAIVAGALETRGYSVAWNEQGLQVFVELKQGPRSAIPWLNVTLFALTVVSVFFGPLYQRYLAAYFLSGKEAPLGIMEWLKNPSLWDVSWGLQFTFWLLAILLAHEFGHYFAGRRRGMRMTFPFFIPFPLSPFGTMGAVIRFKSPIANRRDLVEVGAAGPLAGFVVCLIAILIGLSQTQLGGVPLFSFQGESLLMSALGRLYFGPAYLERSFDLAPAAFAGWAGLLVTALNLIPVSSLDGGHISYGLLGKKHRYVVPVTLAGLIVAGFIWPTWWFWAALVMLYGPMHPATLDDEMQLTRSAKWMGWTALALLVLCLNIRPFV